MSEESGVSDVPDGIVTAETPTFMITLLAFQPENQDQPMNVDELCATLARQEKLLVSYGLLVAGAKVQSVPAEGAGQLLAEGQEVKMVTPLN